MEIWAPFASLTNLQLAHLQFPFELWKRAVAKSPKIPGIFARTDSHTLRCDFSSENSRILSTFEMRNSKNFFGF